MIHAYIGPNGYGKTYYLEKTIQPLYPNAIYIPAEMNPSNELKDTKDTSIIMTQLINELICDKNVAAAEDSLKKEIENYIDAHNADFNNLADEIYSLSSVSRVGDFLNISSKLSIKSPFVFDNSLKNVLGTGQKTLLLLKIAEYTKPEVLIIDEPENHAHPTLLNKFAESINNIGKTSEVYISTHSPILLSMLDIEWQNIYIINDTTHNPKTIDFEAAISEVDKMNLPIGSFDDAKKRLYDKQYLPVVIKTILFRDFIESLFSSRVILCEGLLDLIYINKSLSLYKRNHEEYKILRVWGKHAMPIFASIFKQLDINCQAVYDIDSSKSLDIDINNAIDTLTNVQSFTFDPTLEEQLDVKFEKNQMFEFSEFLDSHPVLIDNVWFTS